MSKICTGSMIYPKLRGIDLFSVSSIGPRFKVTSYLEDNI